jgi:hypothetical protein
VSPNTLHQVHEGQGKALAKFCPGVEYREPDRKVCLLLVRKTMKHDPVLQEDVVSRKWRGPGCGGRGEVETHAGVGQGHGEDWMSNSEDVVIGLRT